MLKNITALLTALVLSLFTMNSFAIAPGAGQAQIQNNRQQMQQNTQQMRQQQQIIQQKKMQRQQVKPQQNQY